MGFSRARFSNSQSRSVPDTSPVIRTSIGERPAGPARVNGRVRVRIGDLALIFSPDGGGGGGRKDFAKGGLKKLKDLLPEDAVTRLSQLTSEYLSRS